MTLENRLAWFQDWLARHPLKQPPEFLGRNYTEEVLIRIRQSRPSPAPAFRRVSLPRFSFALGTVMACALGVLVLLNSSDRPDSEVNEALEFLDEADPDSVLSLAESPVSDEDLIEALEAPGGL